jgi:NAD(P)H-nitrite reductase large subunit
MWAKYGSLFRKFRLPFLRTELFGHGTGKDREMAKEHFVVIGNGPAGYEAAMTLKGKAADAYVTVISSDRASCYMPHLLPDLIAGKIPEETLYVCPTAAYGEKGVKLRTGQRVAGVNLQQKGVILNHKEIVGFTGLIIAVGGKPRVPETLLVFRDLMLTLKTLEDARVWIDKLSQVESVLIMGGDLTAFAVAKALLKLNKKVTFLLDEEAFWPLRSNRTMIEEAAHRLSLGGVKVLLDRRLKSVARLSNRSYEVQLNGDTMTFGLIGAFFGLVPDIRFLVGSGLRIDRGILVNEYLNTGYENVYATGDCAQIYHPEIRDYWVSIGYDNAVNLGRTAALNLLGGKVRAEGGGGSVFEVQGIRVNTSWWMEF